MDLEKAKHEFQKYVETFDLKNDYIRLKLEHTYRVMDISTELAKRKGLSKEQEELATLIGLLHDIGRFYQIEKTKGVNDSKLDHSTYGTMYLFEEGHIRDFIEEDTHDEIIRKAVLYHNDLKLPNNLTKEEELFCKIIRNADKIDIYNVYKIENFHHTWNHKDITQKVLESFNKRSPINLQDKKTKSDAVMCVLAFLMDINFKESFDILKETGNFERYQDGVEVAEESKREWQKLIDFCNKIIESRDKYVR